jgi:GNAT superfamily N-acetyltransferase
MEPIFLRRGVPGDKQTVIDMIDEAATWLRSMGTNQWASPWPDRDARDARVQQGLDDRRTWIAEDAGGPVGTITFRQNANPKLWSALEQGERAVYVSRLVVSRRSAGQEIGARLINWAGHRARQEWGAQWIRIDVWTTNFALHRYYISQGFEFCRFCDDAEYPSAALFQKPTEGILPPDTVRPHSAEAAIPGEAGLVSIALPE